MNLKTIQEAIAGLSTEDYQLLSVWLKDHDNDRWDTQIAEDAQAGRLDELLDEADEEIKAGKTKPLEAQSTAPADRTGEISTWKYRPGGLINYCQNGLKRVSFLMWSPTGLALLIWSVLLLKFNQDVLGDVFFSWSNFIGGYLVPTLVVAGACHVFRQSDSSKISRLSLLWVSLIIVTGVVGKLLA